MGDPDTIRLNVHAEGMLVLTVRNRSPTDRERPVGRYQAQVSDTERAAAQRHFWRMQLVLSPWTELDQDTRPIVA
jgi:hypothetical protein